MTASGCSGRRNCRACVSAQITERTTPPSTRIAAPVVAEACSEARYTARLAISSTVASRLINDEGRCVAMEVCINTGRLAEAISEPDKTALMNDLIAEGTYYGMQTFDQHLVALIRDGVITLDAAMTASTNPHDLTVELRRVGLVA